MSEGREMLIGEFARRCRLPVSTLRYYDQIGLLAPAVVDRASGYRRYRADQLPVAELIARLRAIGVGPDRIAVILAGGGAASSALLRERRRVSKEVERTRRRLSELDDLLAVDAPTGYCVGVCELMPRQVAIRGFTAAFEEQEAVVLRAIGALRSELRRRGHARAGPWGGTFPLDLGDTVEGFVFVPVDDGAGVQTLTLPGGQAVTTVHRAGPASLSSAYLALFARIELLDGIPQAPVVEEYLAPTEIRVSIRFAMASESDQPGPV